MTENFLVVIVSFSLAYIVSNFRKSDLQSYSAVYLRKHVFFVLGDGKSEQSKNNYINLGLVLFGRSSPRKLSWFAKRVN